MAPPKRKGGRTIPGTKDDAPSASGGATGVTKRRKDEPAIEGSASSRYTPPTFNKADMPSPTWVPVLMFALLIIGALVIVLNYMGVLPGQSEADNKFLAVGLVAILGGIVTATQYR
jgi:hypothetical protein